MTPLASAVFVLLGLVLSCQRGEEASGGPPSTDDDDPTGTGGRGGGAGGATAGSGGSVGSGGNAGSGGSAGSGGVGGGPGGRDASAGQTGGSPGGADATTGTAARDSGASSDVVASSGAGCSGIQICDDFEAYAVGAAPGGIWRTLVSSGKVAVDGTRSYSGGKSVMVTVDPAGSSARGLLRLVKPPLPVADNNLYGRMMFWVNAIPTSRVHWFNVWATGRLANGTTATYAIGGLGTTYILNYFPGDCWRNSVTFPTGRWACLRWQFDGSKNPDGTQKNEMRAWLDATSIGTVIKTGSGCVMAPARTEWVAPPFEDLRLGWERAAGNQIQMWMDDIAVDNKPIPCPAKP